MKGVRDRLSLYRSRMRACHERRLDDSTEATGEVVLEVDVAGESDVPGRVTDSTVVTNSVGEPIAGCLEEVFGNFAFPAPQGGDVTVEVTLEFRTTSDREGSDDGEDGSGS